MAGTIVAADDCAMRNKPAALVGSINGRIRLAFARSASDEAAADATATTTAEPKFVDVVAYAEDCVLSGRLPMAAERLSDLLNEHLEFELVDVMVEDLVGNEPIETRDVVVKRDELLLVQTAEPRGNPGRRNHTSKHPIEARIGPYQVRGLVHALPGSDPIESLRRRRPMIALTDATIEFSVGSTHMRREAGVVILNRDCVDTISEGYPVTFKKADLAGEKSGATF
jgi:hypothetical protein